MATVSFWARADSLTAANDSLNPIGTTGNNGFPTTQITFTDNNGAGDLNLDYVANGFDPDTQVIINGVTYNFRVNLTGTLPTSSSQLSGAAAALLGKQVVVITVVIGGVTRELFFVRDGTATFGQMNAIGSGAIPLDAENFAPPPFYPCFCAGTLIATPSGAHAVETLAAGDRVLNDRGEACQIIWTGHSRLSRAELHRNRNLAPIRIPADAFGAALPTTDLLVSPQHRIVLDGPAAEMLFGAARVLAAAKHLVGTFAEVVEPDADVEYVHILTEHHEILLSNGLATESFQPARRTIDVMAPAARDGLERVLSTLGRDDMLTRPDALPSLRQGEARLLAAAMQQPPVPAQKQGAATVRAV